MFKTSFFPPRSPILKNEDVLLRLAKNADFIQWTTLREQSHDFLQPWEPCWAEDELTKSSFHRRVKFYQSEMRQGHSYCFLIFEAESEQLVGGINMSQVRQGVTKSCSLGYWIGAPYQGQGYMTQSVALACEFAFDTLKLHRVEASCLLRNTASIKLLRKQGFHLEGLAREYLKINGCWEDHFLFAKITN